MAKRYVQSGRPVGLPTDEATVDAERRRRNREMVAGRAPRSKKKQKKLVSRDPRIADSKGARWNSKGLADLAAKEEREVRIGEARPKPNVELGLEADERWPKWKPRVVSDRQRAQKEFKREVTMEHGPGWKKRKPSELNGKVEMPFKRGD